MRAVITRGVAVCIAAALALGVGLSGSAGTAGAAQSKPKLVRIIKREGTFTATLTYVQRRSDFGPSISHVLLRIERSGHLVVRRRICQRGASLSSRYRCRWDLGSPSLVVAHVGPRNAPAFLVDLWTGGNTCCGDWSLVILSPRVVWVRHVWTWMDAGSQRIRNRSVFSTGDGRFYCSFSVCAGGTTPLQLWEIDSANRFVDVTRNFPRLIRKQAHALATGGGPHATIRDQGSGVLASWCADEYLLGNGRHCVRVLAYAVKHHPANMQGAEPTRGFVRGLNRDLRRWGYKH